MRFETARDRKLNIVFGIAFVVLGLAPWGLAALGLVPYTVPIPTIGFILVGAVQWFGTYYVVGERELTIRGGFARQVIPFAEVQEVRPVQGSLLNVFGFSAHQVEIVHGKTIRRKVRISPAERERFVAELQARCPQLETAAN